VPCFTTGIVQKHDNDRSHGFVNSLCSFVSGFCTIARAIRWIARWRPAGAADMPTLAAFVNLICIFRPPCGPPQLIDSERPAVSAREPPMAQSGSNALPGGRFVAAGRSHHKHDRSHERSAHRRS
jgi:hypothetical protein